MKKILIYTYSLDIGGVQKSLISLLNNIDYNIYKVDLISANGGVLEEEIPNKVNIVEPNSYFNWLLIPKGQIFSKSLKSIKHPIIFINFLLCLIYGLLIRNMGKARQLLFEKTINYIPNNDDAYDVAIDYSGQFRNIIINKVKADIKIGWIHSDYRVYRTNKKIDQMYFNKLNWIVTVSETSVDIINDTFPHLSHKVKLMENITDSNYINKLGNIYYPEEFNSFDYLKIIDVTRLDPNKGLELALETAYLMKKEGIKFKWFIVGDGPHKSKLEEIIEKYELTDNFYLLGEKSNPYPYIKNADIFVHCSLFEGKSVAIDEAKLMRIPVIVTNYPTAKDQIDSNINGLISELDPNDIYKNIVDLYTNKDMYKNIVSNLEKFDLSVDRSLNTFEYILNNKRNLYET